MVVLLGGKLTFQPRKVVFPAGVWLYEATDLMRRMRVDMVVANRDLVWQGRKMGPVSVLKCYRCKSSDRPEISRSRAANLKWREFNLLLRPSAESLRCDSVGSIDFTCVLRSEECMERPCICWAPSVEGM